MGDVQRGGRDERARGRLLAKHSPLPVALLLVLLKRQKSSVPALRGSLRVREGGNFAEHFRQSGDDKRGRDLPKVPFVDAVRSIKPHQNAPHRRVLVRYEHLQSRSDNSDLIPTPQRALLAEGKVVQKEVQRLLLRLLLRAAEGGDDGGNVRVLLSPVHFVDH